VPLAQVSGLCRHLCSPSSHCHAAVQYQDASQMELWVKRRVRIMRAVGIATVKHSQARREQTATANAWHNFFV
jgi:hypothetical protein